MEAGGDPERDLQRWPQFLFTFKNASSSDGLLVSLNRLRQTRQRMSGRKPHHQRFGARGKDQRKTRRGEPAGRALVGGPCYPSLTTAILALERIDFATGLQWLLYRRKAGALACRTFMFGWFHGSLSHLNLSSARLS